MEMNADGEGCESIEKREILARREKDSKGSGVGKKKESKTAGRGAYRRSA